MAVDALRIVDVADDVTATQILGITIIQAEEFDRNAAGFGHAWDVYSDVNLGDGNFSGQTGGAVSPEYLQLLDDSGSDSSFFFAQPNAPYVDYAIEALTTGPHDLDLHLSSLAGSSNSVWAEVIGVAPLDTQGLTVSNDGTALMVFSNTSGNFEFEDAGIWNIEVPGVYTIRVWARESGVALDSLRFIEPLPS